MDAGAAEELALAEGLDVIADRAAGRGVRLDKKAEGRSARERLQPQGAGAGEEVDHPPIPQTLGPGGVFQNIEHRLPGAIGRGPGRLSLGRDKGAALVGAGDYAHPRALLLNCASEGRRPRRGSRRRGLPGG